MPKGHSHDYTPAMINLIIARYKTRTDQQIAEEMSQTFNEEFTAAAIKGKRRRMGLRSGRTGKFELGNIPSPNAGPKKATSTSFKKGDRPHNWRPVGSERISVDGYIEVKTEEGCPWRQKQKIVWEQHHGPIPTGDVIRFNDGDKLNCDVDNLEKINRQEHMAFNKAGVNEAHDDIKPTLKLICKLDVKARQMLNP